MTTFYNKTLARLVILTLLLLSLSACFGPRLNKKNLNNISSADIFVTQSKNQHLKITLNHLLFRNHPSSWIKDAKWDEYLFTVDNLTDSPVTIDNISIVGALDEKHLNHETRIQLMGATRATKKQYKKAGIKIKLGAGSTKALAGSLAGAAIGAGLGTGLAGSTAFSTSAGTLTGAGGAVVVAVPLVAIGGIAKLVNNKKVSNQIKKRHTTLPLTINGNQQQIMDLFYSAVPGPQMIEVNYRMDGMTHTLTFDLGEELSQLHFKNQKE